MRQEAGIAIRGDADHRTVLALGELGAVGRDQQRQVRERAAASTPERLEDQDVLEGVGEVVLAADDVADAQVGVVGAGAQVIGGHAVAAQQREVLDIGGGFRLLRRNSVVELDTARSVSRGTRKRSANGSPAAARRSLSSRRKLAHSGVEQPGALRARLLGIAGLRRREIAIRQALVEDGLRRRAVQREPLATA